LVIIYVCQDCRDDFPNAFACWECFDDGCVECRNCPYCLDDGCDECRELYWWEWLRIGTQQNLYYMFFGWLLGFGTPHEDGFGAWLGGTWVGRAWQNFLGLFNRGGDDDDTDDCDDNCDCEDCVPPTDPCDCVDAFECPAFAGCEGYPDCDDCTDDTPCAEFGGCGGVAGGCLDCLDEVVCAECDD